MVAELLYLPKNTVVLAKNLIPVESLHSFVYSPLCHAVRGLGVSMLSSSFLLSTLSSHPNNTLKLDISITAMIFFILIP